MTLEQMVNYLNTAFTLELARTEELVMHFMQTRYIYNMFIYNRKNIVKVYIEDLIKLGLVDVDDINKEISPKFKQKRKKMTAVQRKVFDDLEFYQIMMEAFRGMYLLSVVLHVKKAIKPFLYKEVEE